MPRFVPPSWLPGLKLTGAMIDAALSLLAGSTTAIGADQIDPSTRFPLTHLEDDASLVFVPFNGLQSGLSIHWQFWRVPVGGAVYVDTYNVDNDSGIGSAPAVDVARIQHRGPHDDVVTTPTPGTALDAGDYLRVRVEGRATGAVIVKVRQR